MKKVKLIWLIMLIILGVSVSFSYINSAKNRITAYADDEEFTAEEKAAIKAWLSAHGYPPTRAGAEQAYQDFLDGKLDDDPDVRAYKGLGDKDDDKDSATTADNPSGEKSSTEIDVASSTDATVTDADDNETTFEEESIDFNNLVLLGKLSENSDKLILDQCNKKIFLTYEEEKEKSKFDKTDMLLIAALILVLTTVVFALKKPMKPVE